MYIKELSQWREDSEGTIYPATNKGASGACRMLAHLCTSKTQCTGTVRIIAPSYGFLGTQ